MKSLSLTLSVKRYGEIEIRDRQSKQMDRHDKSNMLKNLIHEKNEYTYQKVNLEWRCLKLQE